MSAFSGKIGLSRGGLRPWTPNDLTVKPYLWYDASSATTITLVSTTVTAVSNLGTANATLTGSGSITNSVTQNGLKTFGIDNTSQTQVLQNTTISMTGTTSTSFSAHLNNPSTSGRIIYGRVWSFNASGAQDYAADSGFGFLYYPSAGPVWNLYYFRNNAGIGPVVTSLNNTWIVAGTRRNGTAVITQVNGGTKSTGSTAVGAYASTQVRIGNDQSAADSGMRGNVGEQLHFNYSLIDEDFDRVTGYLAWKWGLQSSLGATHPYKNGAPVNETPPDYTVNVTTASTNVFLLKANSGNTFSDVGGNALAISKETTTVNYSTTIPFATSALNSANFGTGTGFLKPALNSIFAFGTGNWTFECFINLTARPTSSGLTPLFDTEANANGGRPNSVIIYLNASGRCEVYQNGAAQVTSGANVVALSSWTHVAVARNGSTTTIYFNGTSVGSGSYPWDSMTGNNGNLGVVNNIGTPSSQYGISGLMSNARVTKGTAVYTANFTTPTADLSAN